MNKHQRALALGNIQGMADIADNMQHTIANLLQDQPDSQRIKSLELQTAVLMHNLELMRAFLADVK